MKLVSKDAEYSILTNNEEMFHARDPARDHSSVNQGRIRKHDDFDPKRKQKKNWENGLSAPGKRQATLFCFAIAVAFRVNPHKQVTKHMARPPKGGGVGLILICTVHASVRLSITAYS